MTTHVAIKLEVDPPEVNKLQEVLDWLKSNLGDAASDMNDLVWSNRNYLVSVSQNKADPRFDDNKDRRPSSISEGYFLHTLFHSESHALLFKLTWGGQ